MTTRLNPFTAAPKPMKAWLDFSTGFTAASVLEPKLMELVKIRASQINGCANCLYMHTTEARAAGEREERIYLLDAWREATFYTDRERAALAWTEALTRLPDAGAPDALYDEVRAQFSEEELAELSLLITVINGWNRVAVGFGIQYKPAVKAAA